MWALRRSSVHLRNRFTTRICSTKSERASLNLQNCNAEFTHSQVKRAFHQTSSFSKSHSVAQIFSSLIGAKSTGSHKCELKDASSLLETRHDVVEESASEDEMDDESISEAEAGEKRFWKNEPSGLTKCILSVPPKQASVDECLDDWVEAGNEKRRLFASAEKLFAWLESRNHLEFTESDYAFRVNLIAKVKGMAAAEKYIERIPESFRSEIVYVSLLRNYAAATKARETEELFYKMKKLFPLTSKSYDELLFLYKRTNRKKMVDILSLMEKDNIKPSNFTCKILIDAEGHSGNITEMEKIYEVMKNNGMQPSLRGQASIARYYALAGLRDKAEAILKEMESGDASTRNYARRYMLPVYSLLGRDDEVGRLWQECKPEPDLAECFSAIKAWGKLGRIEDAEAVFDELSKIVGTPSSKHYGVLLNVYADHGLVTEGEELFRRMRESGVSILRPAWAAAVRLYTCAGEVEKADAILEEAVRGRNGRPHAGSFFKVLNGYARRGDVHNTEKVFVMMRRAGYVMQREAYKVLLSAYVKANAPAYGFDMRMRADGVVVDEELARMLARVAESAKARLLEMEWLP